MKRLTNLLFAIAIKLLAQIHVSTAMCAASEPVVVLLFAMRQKAASFVCMSAHPVLHTNAKNGIKSAWR
ncbi:hypothetical protein [Sandaracinobacteroides saxicola]|uniref:Uncharacterized protein n=1 Tax=Sandaracinobacteroides saxicola TaxID=2759707 RepID=A0A7G5IIS2_9SPHN|nr:hypothetical protein [Sandaracinobacteroides saxicola]QMW23264.1 hypothetical protein H3309_01765 [Sandaracinobacteroides saxicola]